MVSFAHFGRRMAGGFGAGKQCAGKNGGTALGDISGSSMHIKSLSYDPRTFSLKKSATYSKR